MIWLTRRTMLAALGLAAIVGYASVVGQLADASNPSMLRGAIQLSSNPKGSLLLLTIDLPLAGKFDGLPDRAFVLLEGTQFIDRIKGAGTVRVSESVVELTLDRSGRWLFGSDEALSGQWSAADASARKITVARFRQYWAASKDPCIPHGSPGTGTITHLAQEQALFAVKQ